MDLEEIANKGKVAAKRLPSWVGGVPGGFAEGGVVAGVKDLGDKIHNIPEKKEFRRGLRRRLTPAEASLWKVLLGSKFKGRKFRRQHSVGPYILDFFCVAERLAIELDGEVHFNEQRAAHDRERKAYLNEHGIKVLRFENYLVFQEFEFVLHIIESNFGWWESE